MSSAALAFDADRHVYALDGREVISVTQALREAGIVDERWWSDEACLRGTYVHRAICWHHEGALDQDNLDPALTAYLDAWEMFLRDTGFVVEASEERVCDPVLGYAGTLDVRGRFPRTPATHSDLIDIKTGSTPAWVAAQTAAYARCLSGPVKRWALELRADGTYRLVALTDRADEKLFLACLAVAQWKRAHQ